MQLNEAKIREKKNCIGWNIGKKTDCITFHMFLIANSDNDDSDDHDEPVFALHAIVRIHVSHYHSRSVGWLDGGDRCVFSFFVCCLASLFSPSLSFVLYLFVFFFVEFISHGTLYCFNSPKHDRKIICFYQKRYRNERIFRRGKMRKEK